MTSKVKCFKYGHFAKDCPNKKDQANLRKEEEETTYSNNSHMDLLCENEEECPMDAQDSPSSEDLDDSIVAFGQQDTEKECLRKCIMKVSLNMKVVLKKKCHTAIQEKQQVCLHIFQNTPR